MPMLNIHNVQVYGLESAMCYCRLPMLPIDKPVRCFDAEPMEKREGRAKRLASVPSGTGHDNFLKGVVVQFTVDFTIKAWTQAERYHWFEFISSMSTMHALTKSDLKLLYNEYVDKQIVKRMVELQAIYKANPSLDNLLTLLYSNPCGMKLTAAMTTNYQQIKTMVQQRQNHTLPEWHEFCDWAKTLPYFNDWCVKGEKAT
jgi:hypothetical protein